MRGEPFRVTALWSKEVNDLLTSYHRQLVVLHHFLSENLFNKRQFTMKSANTMMESLGQVQVNQLYTLFNVEKDLQFQHASLDISKFDVEYCFGMSTMTVIDSNLDNEKYFQLSFVEFLEFLARISIKTKLVVHNKPEKKKVSIESEA